MKYCGWLRSIFTLKNKFKRFCYQLYRHCWYNDPSAPFHLVFGILRFGANIWYFIKGSRKNTIAWYWCRAIDEGLLVHYLIIIANYKFTCTCMLSLMFPWRHLPDNPLVSCIERILNSLCCKFDRKDNRRLHCTHHLAWLGILKCRHHIRFSEMLN